MKRKEKPQITLDRIAAECGVSPMTVSRALRRLPSVSERTRGRIFKTAARLGYLPTLRGGRKAERHEEFHARPVQIITRETDGTLPRFHAELMLELIRLLAARRYECVVRVADGSYREFLRMLDRAGKTDAAATLLVGAFPEKELRAILRALPGSILLDDPGKDVPECVYSIFSFDNEQAAVLAVRHLLERKRRRILLVTGPADHFFAREVESGWRKALEDAGLPADPALAVHTDFTSGDAAEKVGAALDSGLKFDAVFTNDEMAGGVYRALLSRGIRIPGKVAVCGCDGLPVGEQLYPTLSTVILDYRMLAEKVIENLTLPDRAAAMHVRLMPVLLARESS
ncbi:MAG: LacI family DNA-binding transcriptional regulator [Lentisphaeria bacterium]|nr:LacI family DNA-binding transcriptional regulator [Lentisphaeria bacterium]